MAKESYESNSSETLHQAKNVGEAIGLMIASAPGGVLGMIGAGLSSFVTSRRIDRLRDTIQHFNRRLTVIEQSIDSDRVATDEYFRLCATGFEAAAREHREFKRRCLGIMLANFSQNNRSTGYETEDHFLELADAVDMHHLEVLDLLNRAGVKERNEPWISSWYVFENCLLLQLLGRDMAMATFQFLTGYGVVKTKGVSMSLVNTNPVGLWWICSYSITPLGAQFMQYLSDD